MANGLDLIRDIQRRQGIEARAKKEADELRKRTIAEHFRPVGDAINDLRAGGARIKGSYGAKRDIRGWDGEWGSYEIVFNDFFRRTARCELRPDGTPTFSLEFPGARGGTDMTKTRTFTTAEQLRDAFFTEIAPYILLPEPEAK